MINDMYTLDLETLVWTKLHFFPDIDEEDEDVDAASSSNVPTPRYFHSCERWRYKLIFFGGMGYATKETMAEGPIDPSSSAATKESLCVLNEVLVFDLATMTWDPDCLRGGATSITSSPPLARYAHLSALNGDCLVIIGGQNLSNKYIEEINVLDLTRMEWTLKHPLRRQCGSYRSLAVSPSMVIDEGKAMPESKSSVAAGKAKASDAAEEATPALPRLSTLPMSRGVLEGQDPACTYLYSNFNFTDVKREFEVVTLPQRDEETGEPMGPITIEDKSQRIGGHTLPPGLRFPTGSIVGQYLIVSGTYLANTSQAFSIWALHLTSLTWQRLEIGPHLASGSWNKAVFWPAENRMLILGNRDRDLVEDYNHRQTNWDHLLSVELDAWGIGQPPRRPMSDEGLELGLQKLETSTRATALVKRGARGVAQPLLNSRLWSAALIGKPSSSSSSGQAPTLKSVWGTAGDFELVCSDGVRLGCDRALLESRWPWFRNEMAHYRRQAKVAVDALVESRPSGNAQEETSFESFDEARIRHPPSSGQRSTSLKTIGEQESRDVHSKFMNGSEEHDNASLESCLKSTPKKYTNLGPDPKVLPRHLHIAEPSLVVLALLQFIYSQCICTRLQRDPCILTSLLVLSKVYRMEDTLGQWAKYAATVVLMDDLLPSYIPTHSTTSASKANSRSGTPTSMPAVRLFDANGDSLPAAEECHRMAVLLYEAAGVCGYEALQLRALRTVVSLSTYLQRKTALSNDSPSHTPIAGPRRALQGPLANANRPSSSGGNSGDAASSSLDQTAVNRAGSPPAGTPESTFEDSNDLVPRLHQHNRPPAKAERLLGIATSKAERQLGLTPEEAAMVQRQQQQQQLQHSRPPATASSGTTPTLGSLLGRPRASSSASGAPSQASSNSSAGRFGMTASNSNTSMYGPTAPSNAAPMLSPRTPSSSSANTHNPRKRFSLFGRSGSSDANQLPLLQPHTPLGGFFSSVDTDQADATTPGVGGTGPSPSTLPSRWRGAANTASEDGMTTPSSVPSASTSQQSLGWYPTSKEAPLPPLPPSSGDSGPSSLLEQGPGSQQGHYQPRHDSPMSVPVVSSSSSGGGGGGFLGWKDWKKSDKSKDKKTMKAEAMSRGGSEPMFQPPPQQQQPARDGKALPSAPMAGIATRLG